MSKRIAIKAELTLQAAKADGQRRFTVDAYHGGPLRVPGFELPIVVDLAGLTHDRVIANLDHDSRKRVGHVDVVTNDGRNLGLQGVVSASSESAREFVESAENGFEWAASIEADPSQIETLSRRKSARANGRSFEGPMYIARAAQLIGVGFVSRGADSDARAMLATRKGKRMSFEAFVRNSGLNLADYEGGELARLHANYEGRNDPEEADHQAVLPFIKASVDPIDVERRRRKRIESACKGDWSDQADRVAELKAAALDESISFEELQDGLLEALRASRPQGHTFHTNNRARAHELVIEAALCLSAGIKAPEKHFDESTLEAADRCRDVGIQSVLLEAAGKNGLTMRPGERITQGNLREVLEYALPPVRASGFSTLSVPGILSNTANKMLQEGWMEIDQTSLRISGRKPVRDFKTVTSYSLTGGFSYEKVGPGGELAHGTVGEETYTNKADTYGKMFAITRQEIINDDLDALSAIPRRLGRGAMLKLNQVFWSLFLNNADFFKSDNKNVSTGAGSALGVDGLAAAEVVFLNQTDPDGEPLGIMPNILLAPPTLKHTARTLINSGLLIDGTSSNRQPSSNVFQGAYSVESSPYMENANYTGFSSTAWYLLSDMLRVIEIAFLNGREAPIVENAEADFNLLGIQMRGYHDFGVAMVEPRGGVRSAGS